MKIRLPGQLTNERQTSRPWLPNVAGALTQWIGRVSRARTQGQIRSALEQALELSQLRYQCELSDVTVSCCLLSSKSGFAHRRLSSRRLRVNVLCQCTCTHVILTPVTLVTLPQAILPEKLHKHNYICYRCSKCQVSCPQPSLRSLTDANLKPN